MPFSGNVFSFTQVTIQTINEVGAVYGFFKPSSRVGFFDCLYVGETDNLKRRLDEHFNNPPIAGITHFFAEAISGSILRKARENQLIAEFNPPGNTIGTR